MEENLMKRTTWCAGVGMVICSGSVMAEVKLSGFVDMSAESIRFQGRTVQRLQSGNMNTSRLVFSDVEKLGGDLEAQFVYEMRFRADTGALTVPPARDSYVALKGDFGRILVGRMRVTSATTYGRIDPSYTATYSVVTNISASYQRWLENNTVKYETPVWNHWQVISSLSLGKEGENLGPREQRKSGQGTSTGVRYQNGSWFTSLVYDKFNNALPGETMQDIWLVGEYWKRRDFKITAALHRYSGNYATGRPEQSGFDWQIGGRYFLNPNNELVMSYVNRNESGGANGDANGLYLSLEHGLSKRTILYATYAQINNRGNSRYALSFDAQPTAGETVRGLSVGISHAF